VTRPEGVVIVGTSLAGLLTAAVLRARVPDVEVTLVGPAAEKRPYVGESLVEPAMLLLVDLGLEPWLQRHCALKNGLTFYHKLRIDDPADRRYSMHAPEALHYLSRQLHRPVFDAELRQRVQAAGARFVEGRVRDVAIGTGGTGHEVSLDDGTTLRARWLIDASGRSRVVGRRATTYDRPPREGQRSALWIRLADFEPFLPHLELTSRRPLAYDTWDSTHHFLGRGYWVWGIPLQSADHERMISIGITWRPDQLPGEAPRDLQGMLAVLDREHPAVADTIRSGRVLDVHTYRDYLYAAQQVYSEDGWFLVGDAARAVDPLYSTGMSMTAIQAEQIAALVGRGCPSADVSALDAVWRAIADARQRDITDQYATMHDPFQAAMRRYWNLCGWFNAVLPLWFNGYLLQPASAAWLARWIGGSTGANESAWRLFGKVSAALGAVDQATFDRTVDFDRLLNPAFDCPPEEAPLHLGRMLRKRAAMRWNLIRMGGWSLLPGQLRWLLREAIGALIVPRMVPRAGVSRVLTFPETRVRGSCLGDPALHPMHRATVNRGL
jgi:flavin-dependent dehydrogenase